MFPNGPRLKSPPKWIRLKCAVQLVGLAIVLLSTAPFVFADPIFLFPKRGENQPSANQVPVQNYRQKVSALQAGDELAFHDGSRFEFLSFIGHGKTTQVLKVKSLTGEHRGKIMALRIPLKSGHIYEEHHWNLNYVAVDAPELGFTFSLYIDDIIWHAGHFAQAGFGPEFYGGLAGQYAAVELIDQKFTLDDYLNGKILLSPEEEKKVEQALIQFEKQATGIMSIQDIGEPGQVLYDGKRFVLIDWFKVKYVSQNVYPWAYYEWPGLVGDFLSHLLSRTKSGASDPGLKKLSEFQARLYEKLLHASREARLEMMRDGLNRLTGRPPTQVHSFYQRNFGSWRKVYRELNGMKKNQQCNQILKTRPLRK